MQLVFIIGAPRSGTTWLAEMLGAHTSVCSTAELAIFDDYIKLWIEAWERQLRLNQPPHSFPHGLPLVWKRSELDAFLGEFVQRIYNRVLEDKPEASVLVDKHPRYAYHLEVITRLVPEAKFIHLLRDGRDVVTSILSANKGWGKFWASGNIRDATLDWRYSVELSRKAQKYENKYLEVRYEDLRVNGVEALNSIFEFMGLSNELAEVPKIYESHQIKSMRERGTINKKYTLPKGFIRKGKIGDWRNVLSPAQIYIFHLIAGGLLQETGYADRQWWISRAYQRFTRPLLAAFSPHFWNKLVITEAAKSLLGPKWTKRVQSVQAKLN